MTKTKKTIFVALTIVSLVTTLTITSLASVVDKGPYSFETTTGEVFPKTQTITMERYPLPTEDGYTYHNQHFETLGNESNYQLSITLKAPSETDGTDITFAFPFPDRTKNYCLEFKGGDFEVWLSPQLMLPDGRYLYHLQTINKTLEGNFGNFYEDFEAVITYQPTPSAYDSIVDYTVSKYEYDYNVLLGKYEQTAEELRVAQEGLEQGNWLFRLFDGFISGIGNFLETIGTFEIGGIALSAVIALVVIAVVAFFVIRMVL